MNIVYTVSMMNLERFDEALDAAKEMASKLKDGETTDIIAQIIHAVDLLADELAKLQK